MPENFNIHEPIYNNIESEVDRLSYSVCFDDDQLNTYSSQITELILRIAVEIEAISIELYQKHCENPKTNISYESAIKEINKTLKLDKTPIMVTSESSYFSDDKRILFPFNDWDSWEHKEGGNMIFGDWHCAYQMLKHNNLNDKYLTMKRYGTLRYLIKICAALFLLNFIRSDSRRLMLNSKVFSVIQKSDNGQYGIWSRSYSGRYVSLDEKLIEIINK